MNIFIGILGTLVTCFIIVFITDVIPRLRFCKDKELYYSKDSILISSIENCMLYYNTNENYHSLMSPFLPKFNLYLKSEYPIKIRKDLLVLKNDAENYKKSKLTINKFNL